MQLAHLGGDAMRGRSVVVLIMMAAAVLLSEACGADGLEAQLYRRFQPSRIEIENPARRGVIVRQGQLLTLAGDAVPAQPFRVMQANPAAPSSHVMEFARIEIRADGRVQAERAPLMIPRGTRVVVLDVRLKGDQVRLLTHTAESLQRPGGGDAGYGCTEFVFQLPSSVVKGGDAEPLFLLIEHWLEWSPDQRTCAPGDNHLCLEP